MSSLRQTLSIFLPLITGVGLLFGLPHIEELKNFERLAFHFPEQFEKEHLFADRSEADDFKITILDFSPDPEANLNIESYLLDKEALEIMGPEGGSPIEWAQFLAQTRLDDDRLTVIPSSLSWDDATELAILALQEQVDASPALVIGMQGEFINSEASIPDYLQASVIPLEIPETIELPEIDYIQQPPSIASNFFGISEVRGLKLESTGRDKLIPMLVRWGDRILPTLTLASLLKYQNLPPGDLILEAGGYLRLGEDGIILKLDNEGRVAFPVVESEQQSASKLQIYPKQAETCKIISPSNAPKSTRNLQTQIQQAHSQKSREGTTYQRWPLPFELGLILVSVLLLQIRKFWIAPFILIALIGGSTMMGQWMLVSPLILATITFFFCPRDNSDQQKN